MRALKILSILPLFALCVVHAQFVQQGNKLLGSDAVGPYSYEGCAAAVSADGNTAIIGGMGEGSGVGAAWVFVRIAGHWSQQGNKLVGTGYAGSARQGSSVSLSADGNTAVVGGEFDSSSIGATWIFTRSNGIWTQQGAKLVGTGSVGFANQGTSVAISGDGNTVAVGGPGDGNTGAVWVFVRINGVWIQQGEKMYGGASPGPGLQGWSVALSFDGNTLACGTPSESAGGGAWVFVRSSGVWSQQGSGLITNEPSPGSAYGRGVSLSADGNTLLMGGEMDTAYGGAWIYRRTGAVWSRTGNKLVGTGSVLHPQQGYSVSLSADGNTALIGGPIDSFTTGAAWVFSFTNGFWHQVGQKIVGTGGVGDMHQGTSVALSGDGHTALVGGSYDNGYKGAAWAFTDSPAGLAADTRDVLSTFSLEQNYPNPFNPSSTIRYSLPVRSQVNLSVFNALGQQVTSLVQGEQEAGFHDVTLDGRDLASGIYFYTLRANGLTMTRRLIILR